MIRLSVYLLAVIFLSPQFSSAQTALQVEDITFRNGEIISAGRLYLPAASTSLPALVFTHGSGDSGRDNPRYKEEAEYLAKYGIISLLYDKRGYGASKGDWHQATFEDLAEDVLAAVRFLKSRSEIDRTRIGLRGASQSGWYCRLLP